MTVAERIAGVKCEGCGRPKIAGHPFCEDCCSLLSRPLAIGWDVTGNYARQYAEIRQARINRGATNSRAAKRNTRSHS